MRNHRPRIIGLAGFAQTGKNSVASFLVVEEGYQEAAFADGVRDFMDELDPDLIARHAGHGIEIISWSEAIERYGYEWTKENTDARDWMVKVGAGARRAIDPDVWIDRVERIVSADPWDASLSRFVISDVRYENEAKMIWRLGGQVWRIDRPGVKAANFEERSSLFQIVPDRHIRNDGTLEDLREKIR